MASQEDKVHESNSQVNPAATAAEVKASENQKAAEKVESRKDEAKEVDTKLGTSPEEKAAERAQVPDERLENGKQNREPKNEFEQENQKVTDKQRKATQKESNLSTEQREKKADEPKDGAQKDAARTSEVNAGSEIAAAIKDGFKSSKDDSFELEADAGVESRFSLVKNKDGEILTRENETGHLSKIQTQSLEEKESSLQDQEVTEL